MSEPNDFQTDEMIRETKIEAAASAMAEMMAQVTGREEDAELIKEGYREMFAPRRTAPAMDYGPPVVITQPKHSHICRFEDGEGVHIWDFEKLLGPAFHVRFVWRGVNGAAEMSVHAPNIVEQLTGTVALEAWAFLEERMQFFEDQRKAIFETQTGGPA